MLIHSNLGLVLISFCNFDSTDGVQNQIQTTDSIFTDSLHNFNADHYSCFLLQ